jgi:hypothetical protein
MTPAEFQIRNSVTSTHSRPYKRKSCEHILIDLIIAPTSIARLYNSAKFTLLYVVTEPETPDAVASITVPSAGPKEPTHAELSSNFHNAAWEAEEKERMQAYEAKSEAHKSARGIDFTETGQGECPHASPARPDSPSSDSTFVSGVSCTSIMESTRRASKSVSQPAGNGFRNETNRNSWDYYCNLRDAIYSEHDHLIRDHTFPEWLTLYRYGIPSLALLQGGS